MKKLRQTIDRSEKIDKWKQVTHILKYKQRKQNTPTKTDRHKNGEYVI